MKLVATSLISLFLLSSLVACGDDGSSTSGTPSTGGSAGSAGSSTGGTGGSGQGGAGASQGGKGGSSGTSGQAGTGGSDAGAGGSDAGAGGSDAGSGGSDAGAAGSDAGSGGSDAGSGGSDAGSGGSDAGAGGSDAGAGGSDAGAGGSDAGAGGSDAGAGGSGVGISDACLGCISANCDAAFNACAADQACLACATGDPTTAECLSNANLLTAVACACQPTACAATDCAAECALFAGGQGGTGGTAGAGGSDAGSGGSSAGSGGSAGGSAGTGGSAGSGGGSVSCKDATECTDASSEICDPDTKTCAKFQCDANVACPANEVCLLQVDGVSGGACYPSCVPTVGSKACGAGKDCSPSLGDLDGFCRDVGAPTTGKPCNAGATSTGCAAGNVCVDDGGAVTCHEACDFWEVDPGCPSGKVCHLGGFCVAQADPIYDPAKLGFACSKDPGTFCGETAVNEAGVCIDTQDGNGNFCRKTCRTAANDCPSDQNCLEFQDVPGVGVCSGLEPTPQSCTEAEQCGDTAVQVCDPSTLTCSPAMCDGTLSCPGNQACLGQVANPAIGACYDTCTPFGANTCGAGKACSAFLIGDSGYCKNNGTTAVNAACTISDTSTGCVAGSECDGDFCRKECNHWSASPGCSSGQACTFNHLCEPTAQIANVAYGAACPSGFDLCGPISGGNSGGACVDFGGGQVLCTQICRIGGSDCSGGKTCDDIFGLGDIGGCQLRPPRSEGDVAVLLAGVAVALVLEQFKGLPQALA